MKVARTLAAALILLVAAAFIVVRWTTMSTAILHRPAPLLNWCVLMLYLWPLKRFWDRRQKTNLIVAATAMSAMLICLLTHYSADFDNAIVFCVPLIFLVNFQLTLPRFVAVCSVFIGIVSVLLFFSSPLDKASESILEWLIGVAVFPIWIWYWYKRDEIWASSVQEETLQR